MESKPIIEIRGLSKTFGAGEGAVTALSDIDLTIERGEIFGIIGLSGAGKSTLVRCINLLERPTAGTVVVDGADMTALTEAQLRQARRSIGMIFQGFNLLMQRTAEENICFPLLLAGTPRREAKRRAAELLEIVGLAERAGAYPAQLSGGQKQRVAIARALATNPKVLLCDEATSALDPTTTQSILALIKQLNRTLGVTVLVITHEMRVVEQICTRVAIISESRISEIGAVEEVFRRPKTDAARRLLFPQGGHTEPFRMGGPLYRIVFDGSSADRPVVADMILRCGTPVNIAFADTKIIDGRIYGQMLLQFPEDEAATAHMLAYLDGESIGYEEVR